MKLPLLLMISALVNDSRASFTELLPRDLGNCPCADNEYQVNRVWEFIDNEFNSGIQLSLQHLQKKDYHLLENDAIVLDAAHQKVIDFVNSLDCVSPQTVHALNSMLSSLVVVIAPVNSYLRPPLIMETFKFASAVGRIAESLPRWIGVEWDKNPDCAECLRSFRNTWLSTSYDINTFNCYADYYGLGINVPEESLCPPQAINCPFPPYIGDTSSAGPELSPTASESNSATFIPSSSTTNLGSIGVTVSIETLIPPPSSSRGGSHTHSTASEFATKCSKPTSHYPSTLSAEDNGGVISRPTLPYPPRSASASEAPGGVSSTVPASNGYRTAPFCVGIVAFMIVFL